MNENENPSAVVPDDWDSIEIEDTDFIEGAPETEEDTAPTDDGESKADQQSEAEQTEGEGKTEADPEKGEVGEADELILKHLGVEQRVSRQDGIALAQKGLDYDRVKQKLTEASARADKAENTLSYFKELADSQNMTLDELIAQTAAAVISERDGISRTDALKRAEIEIERKKLEKEKSDWQKTQSGDDEADAKVKADIDSFMAKFPEIGKDPKAIPAEVWAAVRAKNTSLTEEYTAYITKQKDNEIAQLKQQLEQEKKNKENKDRSTGSLGSNNTKSTDAFFDSLWKD